MRIVRSRPAREVAFFTCEAVLYEGRPAVSVVCDTAVELERGDVLLAEHHMDFDYVRCPCCGTRGPYSHELTWRPADYCADSDQVSRSRAK